MSELLTVEDYRLAAEAKLSENAYGYFASGADDEETLDSNTRAFRMLELWPKVLVDVSTIDLRTRVLGTEISFPLLAAPTAYLKMAHHEGESGVAAGAGAAGTIFTLSTLATTSIEDAAAASDGPKWFQLYVHTDRGLSKSLIQRAEAAGYQGIVLTVDAPILGRRLADERNNFALPEGMSMVNLGDLADDISEPKQGSALAAHVATRHDATLGWHDLDWIRSITELPIVVKGILRADDAARAVEVGADAIVVSNHGGRQLDGAVAAIDALPAVAEAVAGRCEVLMDSGVRSGTDVLKALALGARAVLVGRPLIWGLAVDGSKGVEAVFELFREELSRALALSGTPSVESVDRDLVRRRAY